MELQQGLESLYQLPTPDFEQGLDFYQEVRRFEIRLITRALRFMEGHQGKAALLLNLNATTLNSKIKQYEIQNVSADCDYFELKQEIDEVWATIHKMI